MLVLLCRQPWRSQHLRQLLSMVSAALGVAVATPIVPVQVGSEERCLAIAGRLLEKGFHVGAIRPPTVPEGTSRLRICITAGHSVQDVQRLLTALHAEGIGSGCSAAARLPRSRL